MQDLWRLISFYISFAGFLLVAGISLYRGDAILDTAIRSLVVFAVLWFGQRVLQCVLGMAADSRPEHIDE
ncbi:MAG: hypothetical protein Q7T82_04120 [Armatimonadota bacterium]|nr:hypothetical protein [Armatimonadota bacterium]